MSDSQTQYDCCFVLLKDAPPLWHWQEFSRVLPLLLDLSQTIDIKGGIDCSQTDAADKKLSFRNLQWTQKSFARWLHNSPATADKYHHWNFRYIEGAIPRRTQWQNGLPILYLYLENTACTQFSGYPDWEQRLMVAYRADHASEIDQFAQHILPSQGKGIALQARIPWGQSLEGSEDFYSSYVRQIGDNLTLKALAKQATHMTPGDTHGPWTATHTTTSTNPPMS